MFLIGLCGIAGNSHGCPSAFLSGACWGVGSDLQPPREGPNPPRDAGGAAWTREGSPCECGQHHQPVSRVVSQGPGAFTGHDLPDVIVKMTATGHGRSELHKRGKTMARYIL